MRSFVSGLARAFFSADIGAADHVRVGAVQFVKHAARRSLLSRLPEPLNFRVSHQARTATAAHHFGYPSLKRFTNQPWSVQTSTARERFADRQIPLPSPLLLGQHSNARKHIREVCR